MLQPSATRGSGSNPSGVNAADIPPIAQHLHAGSPGPISPPVNVRAEKIAQRHSRRPPPARRVVHAHVGPQGLVLEVVVHDLLERHALQRVPPSSPPPQVFRHVERVPVHDALPQVRVPVVRVRVLIPEAGPEGRNVPDPIGPVNVGVGRVERERLARVGYEEHVVVPSRLLHLGEGRRQVRRRDLLPVLELEELIPPVAREVHQHVGAGGEVGQRPRRPLPRPVPPGEDAEEGVHGHVRPPVVDLHVGAVKVLPAPSVGGFGEDSVLEGIPRVARHVVGDHQDDVLIPHPPAIFQEVVHAEDVGHVAVVVPEAGRRDEDRRVGGVVAGDQVGACASGGIGAAGRRQEEQERRCRHPW
mmetsp:Transcript_14497/g.42474  ORF Transcript_14497/g.42474 Transcript_14497/m.42474 type:complete len:358 (+) Transcript_14497:261-1334(+)